MNVNHDQWKLESPNTSEYFCFDFFLRVVMYTPLKSQRANGVKGRSAIFRRGLTKKKISERGKGVKRPSEGRGTSWREKNAKRRGKCWPSKGNVFPASLHRWSYCSPFPTVKPVKDKYSPRTEVWKGKLFLSKIRRINFSLLVFEFFLS